MTTLPLRVKRRDSFGAVAELLCDTPDSALSNAKQFREMGFTDVWIEDVDGRRVDESAIPSV